MLRISAILLATGILSAATLDRASAEVHGSKSSSNTSTSNDDDDDSSIFGVLDISTSSSELSRDGSEEGAFAGTTPAAARVAPAEEAPRIDEVAAADLSEQPKPGRSLQQRAEEAMYELAVSWATHDDDVWRWGVDAAGGVDGLGFDMRLDGWRERVGDHTDVVTLASVGIHARFPLDGWDPPTCGLAWLGWYDDVGFENGLAFTARWSQRWHIHLATALELRIGNIGETSYQRYAALIGPTFGLWELQCGYEHVDVGGVLLGGPLLRCGIRF